QSRTQPWDYRPSRAQRRADRQAGHPKPAKLARDPELRKQIEDKLRAKLSPRQAAAELRCQFPHEPEMWVSHEAIYQSIYVQGRGSLRKELAVCLRSGRALRLPQMIWKSLTWDQGMELRNHAQIKLATGLEIYFCDPAKPWQRGSNENTNGLLRQYFPKGTDLSVHGPDYLEFVAVEMNRRPRETLGWLRPAQALARVLPAASEQPGVAPT